MNEVILIQLASIFILGAMSQWLAWRLNLPSILLLLLTGFCVGASGLDFIDPDALLGTLFFPLVSVSVAIILFEGGLSLRLGNFKNQATVISLISVGCLVTWVLTTFAAYNIFSLSWELSLLLGAILTVSGPTVVTPLLRHIRPTPPLGNILKWEGILIDPVGALLAVFVFEIIWEGFADSHWTLVVLAVLKTLVAGGLIGYFCAKVLSFFIQKHLVPESLNNSFTVMLVLLCFIASNAFQKEAGLLGVTVMGLILANTKSLNVRKILEFKENLVVFLISTLFILLAARITPEDWQELPITESLSFLGLLIFVIRPAGVFISTFFSSLNFKQKLFMAFLSPRGIVAAAVASLFALELQAAGVEDGGLLISFTFLVIVGTVTFYGLFSSPLASLLHLRQKKPQGILFVGVNPFSRALAHALEDLGFTAHLIDTNPHQVTTAWLDGLPATLGSAVSDQIIEGLNLDGVGKLFAVTRNHEANALAAIRYSDVFGEQEVYQLAEPERDLEIVRAQSLSEELQGRALFHESLTYEKIETLYSLGWDVKTTNITEEFTYEDFLSFHGEGTYPLFYVDKEQNLHIVTATTTPSPTAGSKLITLSEPNQ